MADQLASAVLSLSTDSATLTQGLDEVKAKIKEVAGTVDQASAASSNDWATMAQAITAVSKRLAEQKIATQDSRQETGLFGIALDQARDLATGFIAALSAERLLAFTASSVEAAAQLHEMSLATGVSGDNLQRLQYAGENFGITAQEMSRGIETFNAKLVGGDASAVRAVQMLGLNVTDLITAGPYEAFVQFTSAATRLQDPMQKNAVYADAFGQRVGRLLAGLGDLTTAIDNVPKGAIISERNLEVATELTAKYEHFKTVLGTIATDLVVRTGEAFGLVSARTKAYGDVTQEAVGKDIELISHTKALQNELDALRTAALQPLSDAQKEQIDDLHKWGEAEKDIASLVGSSQQAVHAYIEEKRQALEIEKQYKAALQEVLSAGISYRQTIDQMNGSDVEAIRVYLQAGVSQKDLAIAYGYTAAQIKAVSLALQEDTRNAENEMRAADLLTEAWATAFKKSDSLIETDKAKYADAALEKYQKLVDTLARMGIADQAYYDSAEDLYRKDVSNVDKSRQELEQHSLQFLRTQYDNAVNLLNAAHESGLTLSASYVNSLRANVANALQAIVDFGREASATLNDVAGKVHLLSGEWVTLDEAIQRFNAGNSMTYDLSTAQGIDQYRKLNPAAGITWSDAQIEAFAKAGGTLQQLIAQGVISPYAGFAPGVNTRAGGGPVSAGMPYIVGERRPELFVPDQNGTIVPSVGGGVHVVVNVTQPLGTPAQLAAVVRNALEYGLRSTGVRING